MNIALFIAKRLIKKSEHRFSRPVIQIAILAIALSLAVMLVSVSVINGFQKEIRDKVIGFNSHIQVTHFSDGKSFESSLLQNSDSLQSIISGISGVTNTQKFATKAGLIKTQDEIHGVVLKGVDQNFDSSFFAKNLVLGEIPIFEKEKTSDQILLSKSISSKLNIDLGDKISMYFVQKPARVRNFQVAGIYETGLSEFDDLMLIGDLKHILKLNGWDSNACGGLEVEIQSFADLNKTTDEVYASVGYDLNAQNIVELNPQIFDWLKLQDINVQIILILMILVGVINMITALFILILERTQLIGILKSLGSNNWHIRKIFLYHSAFLISKGLLFGNLIGIGLLLIQKQFHIIQLDPATYYMSEVPVHFSLEHFFLLNLGTLLVCILMLVGPTYLISKINPIKAIRYA
jgi:lipoprotein-releasing system permease protein